MQNELVDKEVEQVVMKNQSNYNSSGVNTGTVGGAGYVLPNDDVDYYDNDIEAAIEKGEEEEEEDEMMDDGEEDQDDVDPDENKDNIEESQEQRDIEDDDQDDN